MGNRGKRLNPLNQKVRWWACLLSSGHALSPKPPGVEQSANGSTVCYVAAFFTAMGLQNTRTGTWESQTVGLAQAATQMNLVLQALANPQAVPGVHPQAALNHLWVYIDRA
jgi:hypothetical protein